MAIRLIALLSAGLFPFTALASDYGTYRPGSTYMSVPATSPEQCISQCQGDAQCKGWNFVQISHHRKVCEFNARKVRPIASAISISGDNETTMDNFRVVPGGQRTVRVGQLPKAVASPTPVRRVAAPPPPLQQPRVVRAAHQNQAVSTTMRPMPQTTRPVRRPATVVRQGARRSAPSPVYQPQLDTIRQPHLGYSPAPQPPAHQPPAQQAPTHQAHAPQMQAAPRFQPQLDSMMPPPDMASPPEMAPSPPPSAEFQSQAYAGPPISDAPGISSPPTVLAENVPGMTRPRAMPDPSRDLAGGPIAGNLPPNNSLYGSLYDDVKAPRSLGRDDIPADPDAPISTVKTVPVE